MPPLFPLLGQMALQWGSHYLKTRHRDKRAVARARHKHLMIAAESQQAWQAAMAAASGQSWKDEAWTLSFIIILAMCFIPPLQPYLAEGFAILDTTPEWFRWAMLASIGASFGLRGFDRFTGRK